MEVHTFLAVHNQDANLVDENLDLMSHVQVVHRYLNQDLLPMNDVITGETRALEILVGAVRFHVQAVHFRDKDCSGCRRSCCCCRGLILETVNVNNQVQDPDMEGNS